MSAAPVSLDNGPPLPQQLQAAQTPGATVGQMAGQQGALNGSASLQQQIVEQAMSVEKILNDMATALPALAGPLSGFVDQFRKLVGGALAKGAQPPSGNGLMGPGGSMTLMPGGAPSS